MIEKLLTPAEAAKKMDMKDVKKFREWAKHPDNDFPIVWVKNRFKVNPECMEEWVKKQGKKPKLPQEKKAPQLI